MEKLDIKNEVKDTILIVDDIPKNIQLLGKILDNNGCGVIAVTDGKKALKSAKKYSPDLILLDIMMPEISGYEVCEELKADKELVDIPVIFLTARTEEEDIVKGLSLGGADYVTKPFNKGELLARIETHLNLKKAHDRIRNHQEELKQLTITKEKLYSIIAHDLRGALFGIIGLGEMVIEELNDGAVNGEIKEMIELIHNSANSANLILENLLTWTRLQTDILKLNPELFSLDAVIQESTRLYQALADKKKIDLAINSEDKSLMVYADKGMISTVIRNLISNAIKFSEEGDLITIRVLNSDKGIQFSVIDQGVGMPDEVKDEIFNPENRPKHLGTDQETGTGLGLMLCKEFVKAHNGEIDVMSEIGAGSEFRVTLPAKP